MADPLDFWPYGNQGKEEPLGGSVSGADAQSADSTTVYNHDAQRSSRPSVSDAQGVRRSQGRGDGAYARSRLSNAAEYVEAARQEVRQEVRRNTQQIAEWEVRQDVRPDARKEARRSSNQVNQQFVRQSVSRQVRDQAGQPAQRQVRGQAERPTRQKAQNQPERPAQQQVQKRSEMPVQHQVRGQAERPTRQQAQNRPDRPTQRQVQKRPDQTARQQVRPEIKQGGKSADNVFAAANRSAGQSVSKMKNAWGRLTVGERFQKVSLGGFATLMVTGCLVGLCFFARPTVSTLENRTLTPLPAFTAETVLNGQYFSDLSTWYSDTYPLREMLVSASQGLKGLFGIQPDTQVVGTAQVADELPSESEAETVNTDVHQEVEVPTEEAMAEEIQGNIMGRLYVEGDAAYSVYYFSKESVQQYAAAISIAAKRLEGQADVYSMVVPNNSAVMLDEATLAALGGTDQNQAIKYFCSLYDPLVRSVSTLDTLRAHNTDYVYFRADHHWTADGAYLAYIEFCSKAGIVPVDKKTLDSVVFEPFLGSYYTQLNLSSMEENPDYVKAYYPRGTNIMLYYDDYGNEVEGSVIQNVEGWAESSLYNAFICGDQQLCHIFNPEITDDSSILLVKDSFGCAFAPWLVNNYRNVWIIDFRYCERNIVDFVKENDIKNLLFLNNIEIAGTTTVANRITGLVSE